MRNPSLHPLPIQSTIDGGKIRIEVQDTMTTTATAVGISRLGQIQVRAHDVARAAAFYENVLGLKLLFKVPPGLAFLIAAAYGL
jgi:catechol-2,3-dioxygenase